MYIEPRLVHAGVVDVVNQLAREVGPDRIELVTHSTTQAVNALLEGDGAKVGMIGMGRAPDLRKARKRTIGPRIELSEGRTLSMVPRIPRRHPRPRRPRSPGRRSLVLHAGGAEAVASRRRSHPMTSPTRRRSRGRGRGRPPGDDVGRAHRAVRPRAAVGHRGVERVDPPVALRTAEVVERGGAAAGIRSPVMVMRGDGGATDLSGFRHARPARSTPARGIGRRRAAIEPHRGRGDRRGRWHVDERRIDPPRAARALVRADRQPRDCDPRPRRARARCRGWLDAARPPRSRLRRRPPQRAHRGVAYACFLPDADFAGATTELRRAAPATRPTTWSCGSPTATRRAHQHVRRRTHWASSSPATTRRRSGRGPRRVRGSGRALRLPAEEVARRMRASTQAIGDLVASVIPDHHLERPVIVAVGGGAGGLGRAVAGAMKLDIVVPERAEVISAIGDALSSCGPNASARSTSRRRPNCKRSSPRSKPRRSWPARRVDARCARRAGRRARRGAGHRHRCGRTGLGRDARAAGRDSGRSRGAGRAAVRRCHAARPVLVRDSRRARRQRCRVRSLRRPRDRRGRRDRRRRRRDPGSTSTPRSRGARSASVRSRSRPTSGSSGAPASCRSPTPTRGSVLETAATLTDGGSDATIIIGRT